MTVKIPGELEVDVERGVLYFHNYRNGMSTLRICGLKDKLANFTANTQLDITVPFIMRSDLSINEIVERRADAREAIEAKQDEKAKNFFLNEMHTTHITKAQARKERAAARKKKPKKLKKRKA